MNVELIKYPTEEDWLLCVRNGGVCYEWYTRNDTIKRILTTAPTVDAVEVVRCKDCISGKGATHKVCPLYKQGLMKDDDYCSVGERKNHD